MYAFKLIVVKQITISSNYNYNAILFRYYITNYEMIYFNI